MRDGAKRWESLVLTGREKKFCFAEAADDGEILVAVKGLHHPRIDGAISNDLEVTATKNVFFLTGANMAGKSTLMKVLTGIHQPDGGSMTFEIIRYFSVLGSHGLPRGGNFHAVPNSGWYVHVY